MPKFVCTECGCKEVYGVGTATAEVKIDEDGMLKTTNIDWELFEDMRCAECGSENVVEIGEGRKYEIAI